MIPCSRKEEQIHGAYPKGFKKLIGVILNHTDMIKGIGKLYCLSVIGYFVYVWCNLVVVFPCGSGINVVKGPFFKSLQMDRIAFDGVKGSEKAVFAHSVEFSQTF